MSAVPRSVFPPPPELWVNRSAHWSEAWRPRLSAPVATALGAQGLHQPRWVAWNDALAQAMGWPADWRSADAPSALDVFSGNALWPGMEPVATVYSGHQFGVWAGQLGDGRVLLLGDLQTNCGAQEIQLKGAGATPYSRRADGRAVLRSSIREFLCSEAMHGLGIPTTRALCLTASAQAVRRETMETAAVVTRVAPSFIRFGHFEHFAHSGENGHHEVLQSLLDFVIEHHLAEHRQAPNRALALLQSAVDRTADLMAAWQAVGFCHGVMNTDNMSILGLTIDYGPFGFLDGFDPQHICNHSDDRGRYAWQNQPQIGYWNLHALAQALMPLLAPSKDAEQAMVEVLKSYEQRFADAMRDRWRAKLGLSTQQPDDGKLAVDLLSLMAEQRADFTITFRRLCDYRADLAPEVPANAPLRDLFLNRPGFDAWARRYAARLAMEGGTDASAQTPRHERMRRVNPLYILRNHMAETAIRRAQAGEDSEVRRLHQLLQRPFDEQAGCELDADFPPDWAQAIEVSCSS
ncbi:MAG: YdiU family protein [Burkholderiales bacterium]|nr:YdiU family protein [Burkholderiales bacterium]